jgi:hypothetical protein
VAPILDGPGDVPPNPVKQGRNASVAAGVNQRTEGRSTKGRKGKSPRLRDQSDSAARKHAVAIRRGANELRKGVLKTLASNQNSAVQPG